MGRLKIPELFEKLKFRKASIYFYQRPMSVTEVERISGVSRGTIYNFFRVFKITEYWGSRRVERYDPNYMESSGLTLRSTHYCFTPKLLVNWLGGLSSLNAAEIYFLFELFKNKMVDKFLRSADSWYAAVQRVGTILALPAHFQKTMEMYPKISPSELVRVITDKPMGRRGRIKRPDLLKFVQIISTRPKRKAITTVAGYPEGRPAEIQEMVNSFFRFVLDSPEVARSSYEKLSKANFPFEAGNPITNLREFLGMLAGLLDAVDRMRK